MEICWLRCHSNSNCNRVSFDTGKSWVLWPGVTRICPKCDQLVRVFLFFMVDVFEIFLVMIYSITIQLCRRSLLCSWCNDIYLRMISYNVWQRFKNNPIRCKKRLIHKYIIHCLLFEMFYSYKYKQAVVMASDANFIMLCITSHFWKMDWMSFGYKRKMSIRD